MTSSLTELTRIDRTNVLKDNEARRDFGKRHMSAVMIFWISRNDWSHPIFEELATFALNEDGALHTSQISHIRNGRMRMLGVKTIDALGAINLAVWAFHNNKAFLKELGCAQVTKRIEDLLQDAEPLLHPVTGEPLDAGDFMNLYLGYIKLPGVVGGASDSADFDAVAGKIGGYIESVIRKTKTDFVEARVAFTKAFGGNEEAAKKMVAAAAGLETYTSEELTGGIKQICEALERLDGKARTPEQVVKELSK